MINFSTIKLAFETKVNSYFSKLDFKTDDISIRFSGKKWGKLYLGNKLIGICSNLNRYSKVNIPLRTSIANSLSIVYDCFAQCTTKDNSSNSPSMLFHQLAALTLGCAIQGRVKWEETSGSYTPDLLLVDTSENIFIDICGENLSQKIKSMPENVPKICFNKYAVLDYDLPFLNSLRFWSKCNDSNDQSLIIDLISKQNSESEKLLSIDMLDFFKNKDSVQRHYQPCSQALYEIMEERLSADNEDVKETEETLRNDSLRNMILEFVNKFADEALSSRFQNDFFIFPRVTDLDIMRAKKSKSKTIDEKPSWYEEEGFIFYGLNNEEELVKLYEPCSEMIVAEKTFKSLMDYPSTKEERRKALKRYFNEKTEELGFRTSAWFKIFEERIHQKLGIKLNEPISVPKLSKGFVPSSIKKDEMFDAKSSYLNETEMDIDPDHQILLRTRSMSQLEPLLRSSRDYSDLRFKSRVSLAICNNKKPEKCFRVNHWCLSDFYALVKIKGLILEKDKGVVYVSYFCRGDLYRSEKWRLADIENYSVAHHRSVCIIMSFLSSVKRPPKASELCLLIRIVSENSWGLSKFLKVYRYLASGICMRSDNLKGTIKKLEDSIDNSVKSKLSFKTMLTMLKYKCLTKSLVYGKTPMFGLDFNCIGWECFLVNLCPSNTYGKFRHLQTTVTELADEIDLYDSLFSEVSTIYKDFSQIIKDDSKEIDLYYKYKEHFSMVIKFSEISNGRFTFSPASIVALYSTIFSQRYNYKMFQGSVPPLSELMTAKGSTDSLTGRPSLAVESIRALSMEHKTTSTSLLCLSILENLRMQGKKIDLTMRMFDKDQVGGDREISILSSEFRILQVIVERFFDKWAKTTGVDKLHDPDKFPDLLRSYEQSRSGFNQCYLTADHTRWGPNFNTITFGLLLTLLSSITTESYLPSLICYLSEFKVFEMPCWIPNVYKRSNSIYTVAGMLGRSHMGQGIFHSSSSMYHSLVAMDLSTYLKSYLVKDKFDFNTNDINVIIDIFITSDDIAMISYFQGNTKDLSKDNINDLRYVYLLIRRILRNPKYYFILRGILTSSYKNICSDNVAEFNSFYVANECIASVDIKYAYSLIDPATTGNFLNDFYSAYDSYILARNSQCSHSVACIISNMNLIKVCRQWKIRFDYVNLPKDDDLISGIPRVYTINNTSNIKEHYLTTESNLRYKTRRFLEEKLDTGNKILDEMTRYSLLRMKGTRERTAYRSILTHSTDDKIRLCSDYFLSSEVMGETYTVFARETVHNSSHIDAIINRDYQTTFGCYPEERKTKKGMFKILKLRDPVQIKISLMDLIVSHYPMSESLSLDPTKIQLHMMRSSRTAIIEEPLFDWKVTDFVRAISICEEKIRELEMTSTACKVYQVGNKDEEVTYTRYVYYPPSTIKFLRRKVSIRMAVSLKGLSDKHRYYPSKTVDIIRVAFNDNRELKLFREFQGVMVPNQKMSNYELPEMSFEALSYVMFNSLMSSEEKYREDRGEKVFVNIAIDSTKIKGVLTDDDKKSLTISDSGKTIEKMLEELNELDTSIWADVADEFAKELDEIGEDDGINDLPMVNNIDWFSTANVTKRTILSVELPHKFGFLTNPSWTLEQLIIDSYIKRMIEDGVIYSQSWREFNLFENSSDQILYTFDPNFKRKLERLVHFSKSIIRQFNIQDRMDAKNSIIKILTKRHGNNDIWLFLLNGFSYINFTSEAMGSVVSSDKIISLLSEL